MFISTPEMCDYEILLTAGHKLNYQTSKLLSSEQSLVV